MLVFVLEGKWQIWPWGVVKPIPWYSLLANICLLFWLHPRVAVNLPCGLAAGAGELGRRYHSQSWKHKTRWHRGWNTALGCGRFESAPAVVPACPWCQLLLRHLSRHRVVAFWGELPGKGGGEDVKEEILWALSSGVSCSCPDLPQMCPSPALQLISSFGVWSLQWVELHPEKKSVRSGTGQLHTWVSAVH